jgi:hypothetical protein
VWVPGEVIVPMSLLKNVVSVIGQFVPGWTLDGPFLSRILAVWGKSLKQIFGTALLTKK